MNQTILIVDDDDSIRLLVQHYLRDRYRVISAPNGLEAMSLLMNNDLPDLIITDINMPHMDGIALLKNLKISGFYRNIPVILLSGINSDEEYVSYKKHGAVGFLKKPFDPQELRKHISDTLEGQLLYPQK